jgi:serine/threonine protein phosphatase PrpC
MRAVWNTQRGIKNSENQDSTLIDPGMRYFLLADGVGGEAGGAVASSIAVNTMSQTIAPRIGSIRGSAEVRSLIIESIKRANTEIRRVSAEGIGLSGMASTIALAAISGRDIITANVGDTRVYAWFNDHLSLVSSDHSAVTELVRHRLLRSAQMRSHPFRNIITRSLGHAENVEPFVGILSTANVGLLLLCTDGIWSVLEDSVLEGFLAQKNSLEEKCVSILNAAAAKGSTDDLTCVLVDTR